MVLLFEEVKESLFKSRLCLHIFDPRYKILYTKPRLLNSAVAQL